VPPDLQDPEPVRAKFIGLIEEQLKGVGLRVIPPATTGPVVEGIVAEKGGVFDPVTGKVDEAKAKAVVEEAVRRVRTQLGADALLRPYLRVVSARLDHDAARWDGATEYAGTGFWKRMLVGTHSGRVAALSVVVRLEGGDGRLLYANAGGLRVISRVDAGGKFEPIPRAELFGDEERNVGAVHLALDPLLTGNPRP
jgi:hypothetical protein